MLHIDNRYITTEEKITSKNISNKRNGFPRNNFFMILSHVLKDPVVLILKKNRYGVYLKFLADL